jgi:hypothetical protein
MNFGMLVHVAGILSIGAIIADTGLGTALSGELLNLSGITPGHDVINLVIITAIFSVIGLFTTVIGLPVILVPLAGDFAAATGLPVFTVLMLQVVVISAAFFPYQNFLIIIAMQYGDINLKEGTIFCFTQAVVTVLVLFPLNYVWWSFLGYLPWPVTLFVWNARSVTVWCECKRSNLEEQYHETHKQRSRSCPSPSRPMFMSNGPRTEPSVSSDTFYALIVLAPYRDDRLPRNMCRRSPTSISFHLMP